MPNLNWSKLTGLQLGRYAEYYAKMEFASYGFEVYTCEVDDHGVDFIAKKPESDWFYEVQVKAVRNYNYVPIRKSKMPQLKENRLVCFLHFFEEKLPDVFVIPSTVWEEPNAVFVDRDYDKPNLTSTPEWGISISQKNYSMLDHYKAEIQLNEIK